jgi:exopolyphosphatase/guanosine-5'-triphosphate,3'-diphosphate pyrophosphatase
MRDDRRAIIGGGLSVMRALFSLLGITEMKQASGGLRHGLICDLTGGARDYGDLRAKSVQRLASKFAVDLVQSARVSKVATHLLQQVLGSHEAADPERLLRKLGWAASLHEIGSHIAHSDYHKHGAYILDNADAAGFSLSEMHRLSLLVLGHRGKLRKLEAVLSQDDLVMQLICLRLAVILCHARRDPDLKGLALTTGPSGTHRLHLACRTAWAAAYPQSAHLLREEELAWHKAPWTLHISGI